MPKVKAPKILALLATLNPIPIFTFPEIPTPPVTLSAPVVDEVVLVFESIDTAPTNVEVDCTLNPDPILAVPETLKPVPPIISPLTPMPPTT